MNTLRVLIVEDQFFTCRALVRAVEKNIPLFFSSYTLDVAKWYRHALELIKKNVYDLVLLDHRMPYDEPGCTDEKEEDFKKFSSLCENIGYELIPMIRQFNSEVVIIGTSSMKPREFGFIKGWPDITMVKHVGADGNLLKILSGLYPIREGDV